MRRSDGRWITVGFDQGLFQLLSTQQMALLFRLLGECHKLIAVLLISAAVIDNPCHFANSNAVVPKGSASGGSESRQVTIKTISARALVAWSAAKRLCEANAFIARRRGLVHSRFL